MLALIVVELKAVDFFHAGARCTHTVSLAERVGIRCSAGQEMASTGTTLAC